MTKKRIEKPRREFTKRQLSHWQRQKKRQRIIAISGLSVIAAVIILVGAGWYISQYKPLHETVIRVNDTEFSMDYYVKTLKFYGEGQSIYYMYSLADEAVRIIEQNELARQEAMRLGISVSNDAVDEQLESRDPPLSRDYRDLVRAEMLITKLHDEHFEQEVPVFSEQRHIMAMFLESESQAQEVRARLEAGEDFTELADELSLDGLSEKGDLGWQSKDVLTILLGTPILSEHAFSAEVGALSQPIYDEDKTKGIGYWLIEVLEREGDEEEASVQAMVLESEEEAQEVRARLEAGEDFATLSEEFSQLAVAEKGGYLGLLTPGMMTSAFDEVVFDAKLEPGTLSEPVKDEAIITREGYWLLKVLDKADNRQIEEADRDLLKAKALSDWVSALWDNSENIVESYLDDEKKAWAIERALKS